MRKSKYRTVGELSEEEFQKAKEQGLLMLHTSDIDLLLKEGKLILKGRQVYYGGSMVFPEMPIEFPKNANVIEIKAIKRDKNKQND